ncbi:MAG TPA: hypothetical protein DIT05_11395 [Morganella sp. (in: Bacteria)]|nr:hypothetical protein [Morganella sp. (in: enterobacteria)]
MGSSKLSRHGVIFACGYPHGLQYGRQYSGIGTIFQLLPDKGCGYPVLDEYLRPAAGGFNHYPSG